MTTTLSRAFQFDLVCHEGFSQDAVFSHSGAAHLVDAALEGVKATILAYGATSSGKTYTMSGLDESSPGAREAHGEAGDAHEGLILKSARYLYERIATRAAAVEVTASYCEVYNEQVFDLLNLTGRPLAPRHQSEANEFFVPGLLEVRCEALSDVTAVLEEGHQNRRRASHDLNQDSSRSHSLLTLHVLAAGEPQRAGVESLKRGKLVFVDLAGSERLKKSKTSDAEETGAINKSLFTLAKVISLLADHDGRELGANAVASAGAAGSVARRGAHIPYRDSTLTKLLSDALGGDALALFIACVSPSSSRSEETLATLHYASRARCITNRPKVRVTGGAADLSAHEAELLFLREEVARLRAENRAIPELEASVAQLEEELKEARLALLELQGGGGITTSPVNAGAPKGAHFNLASGPKAKLSSGGSGMRGRPPPGAAGRDLRDALEKLKSSKSDLRRMEGALASATAREASARREASSLRVHVDQLQTLIETQEANPGAGNTGQTDPHEAQREAGGGAAVVAAQREAEKLRVTVARLKAEKMALAASSEGLERGELEERASVAEQSRDQTSELNAQLQQQLREREEEVLLLRSLLPEGVSPLPRLTSPHVTPPRPRV